MCKACVQPSLSLDYLRSLITIKLCRIGRGGALPPLPFALARPGRPGGPPALRDVQPPRILPPPVGGTPRTARKGLGLGAVFHSEGPPLACYRQRDHKQRNP